MIYLRKNSIIHKFTLKVIYPTNTTSILGNEISTFIHDSIEFGVKCVNW